MKLIRIRYSGATNTRGSRWIAYDGDHRMMGGYDYASEDGHDGRLALARQFAEKYWRMYGREIDYLGDFLNERYFGIVGHDFVAARYPGTARNAERRTR